MNSNISERVDVKYGHRSHGETVLNVEILPNGLTCCITEMRRSETNYPKYGTILAIIKSFKREGIFYKVDSTIGLENTQRIYREYGVTIANQKLVLELSVMFNAPESKLPTLLNKDNNYGWEHMKSYLYSGESWASKLSPGDELSLFTNFIPIPLNRSSKHNRGVRLSEGKLGRELSIVVKQFARNINVVQPYKPSSNLYKKGCFQRRSPLEAFSMLTEGLLIDLNKEHNS